MCQIDTDSWDYDSRNFCTHKTVRARKRHKCVECGSPIEPGSQYDRCTGKDGNQMYTEKTCLPCREIIRSFLQGAYYFGSAWEYLDECRDDISIPEVEELSPEARDKLEERLWN